MTVVLAVPLDGSGPAREVASLGERAPMTQVWRAGDRVYFQRPDRTWVGFDRATWQPVPVPDVLERWGHDGLGPAGDGGLFYQRVAADGPQMQLWRYDVATDERRLVLDRLPASPTVSQSGQTVLVTAGDAATVVDLASGRQVRIEGLTPDEHPTSLPAWVMGDWLVREGRTDPRPDSGAAVRLDTLPTDLSSC